MQPQLAVFPRLASVGLVALVFGGSGLAAAAGRRSSNTPALELVCSTNRIAQYDKLEFRLEVPRHYRNPFDPDEVEVHLEFTRSSGQKLSLPAFYGQRYERRRLGAAGQTRDWMYPVGDGVWQARFASAATGRYRVRAVLTDKEGTMVSNEARFACVASTNPGFIRVSRQAPRFLEFSSGRPFFSIGQNLAFIGNQQYMTLTKTERVFGELAANGANYLRVWTCCGDWAMALEARKSAFGRSWDWRPPLAELADGTGRTIKCLKVSSDRATLRVDPSHPVAMRPRTRYRLDGSIKCDRAANLAVDLRADTAAVSLNLAPSQDWGTFNAELGTGPEDYWLSELRFRLVEGGDVWLRDLSLQEAGGGPELLWEAEPNRPARGFYNPVDCFMLDELLAEAERDGIRLQLCLLTRDLYMDALKEPAAPEYTRAILDASKLLRYAVARWGYSTSVAAWEYWNEMNPNLPTDRFYAELGSFLERTDPYHHLRTTSTWGPSAKDCRHPALDVADVHFYLRPSDQPRLHDEVEAILDRTRWLRAQAPDKPAHLGEFGVADERWGLRPEMQQNAELADFHNALWASALSGASGTAMMWWWERLDQRRAYEHYRPLSRFLAEVPWTSPNLKAAAGGVLPDKLRLVGLQTSNRAWIWLFDPTGSWPELVLEHRTPAVVEAASIELSGLRPGTYRVRWWDTRLGTVVREETVVVTNGHLRLTAPAFRSDLACAVAP